MDLAVRRSRTAERPYDRTRPAGGPPHHRRGAAVALALIVVGVGKRGRHWIELARSRGHRVLAVVDPSEEALATVAVNGTRGHRDLDEALAASEADAVIVASPPADRAAAVLNGL